jgi:pilus assembly protein Flp/PilA
VPAGDLPRRALAFPAQLIVSRCAERADVCRAKSAQMAGASDASPIICGFGKYRPVAENLSYREHGTFNRDEVSGAACRKHACQTSEESFMSTIARFIRNESGATAIEYGLIAAGISIAIITIVNSLGGTLNEKFTSINSQLK